jgi:hypothetical protein
MPGDDMVVRVESGSADKEHVPPKKVHEHPESENELIIVMCLYPT